MSANYWRRVQGSKVHEVALCTLLVDVKALCIPSVSNLKEIEDITYYCLPTAMVSVFVGFAHPPRAWFVACHACDFVTRTWACGGLKCGGWHHKYPEMAVQLLGERQDNDGDIEQRECPFILARAGAFCGQGHTARMPVCRAAPRGTHGW
jgi:hypothetical protein